MLVKCKLFTLAKEVNQNNFMQSFCILCFHCTCLFSVFFPISSRG